jgi:predicted phosphodiesterase
MRIAAISDIHGNLPALEAVLADIDGLGADVIVNLGDIASGPLWPRETIERLMPLGLATIAGNHERQVLTDPDKGASDAFAAAEMTDEQRTWFAALPKTRWLTDDVFLCHATPTSDLYYWQESVDDGADRTRPATIEEIRARVGGFDLSAATLVLCGHTHVQRATALDARTTIVNAGSVGLQAYYTEYPHPHIAENGTPHARYTIVERAPGRGWNVTHRAVAYDWRAAAERADAGNRPEWARALRTGRVRTE